MGKLQRALLQAALQLTSEQLRAHPVFAPRWDQIAVLLSGSAVTEYADEYSGIDLIVLGEQDVIDGLREELQRTEDSHEEDGLIELQLGSRRVKLSFYPFAAVERGLRAYDDFVMAAFPSAPVLHDPTGRFAELVKDVDEIPREVMAAKIRQRYGKMRRRQAAIAWNLRRGQPYALLDNLNRFLAHALAICFYVSGKPPTGRKWIFQGALKTEAGRRLRPHLFELFSTLGDLATLGGSLHIRNNQIYQRVARIHDTLVEIVREAGFELDREAVREARR